MDNRVTAAIDHLSPESVVLCKGLIAGGANLLIGLLTATPSGVPDVGPVLAVLLVGGLGYGISTTLWVRGARDLGSARAQVVFALGPFIGVALAWFALSEPMRMTTGAAVIVAAIGVGLSLRSSHSHPHQHQPVRHNHEHTHPDPHHDHVHAGFAGRHEHAHVHRHPLQHTHKHVPDLHHRHDHA